MTPFIPEAATPATTPVAMGISHQEKFERFVSHQPLLIL
jgi:hypothetical protein